MGTDILGEFDNRDIDERLSDPRKTYYGNDIESSPDHKLMEDYMFMLQFVKDIREAYELCIIEKKDKYSIEGLVENARQDDANWLLNTNAYSELANELIKRGYIEYIDILWNRHME